MIVYGVFFSYNLDEGTDWHLSEVFTIKELAEEYMTKRQEEYIETYYEIRELKVK